MKKMGALQKARLLSLIPLIVLTLVMALSITAVATLAIWTESYQDEKTAEVEIDQFNPSLKHIVFSPLDSQGDFTSEENAVSYAAVGYTGLVAELEIPSTYNSKPVTAILVDSSHIDQAFTQNQVITSLVIASSVIKIGSGVFSNCENLKEITLKNELESSDPIEIGDYAFMGTSNLEDFIDNGRTIQGELDLIFFMSKYVAD